jgi:hypothetical protein
MAKLIGKNPNQVPSNADLGSAAFMSKDDFLQSKGSNISEISAVVEKTALDVFVYDTTKDSDGGAWRYRTKGASWYNEKLNTTTRGSRREFPQVAVLVLESDKVTIYDGDDPTLPMWMIFETNSTNPYPMIGRNTQKCVTMLNGEMTCGSSDALSRVNFISDSGRTHRDLVSATYLNGEFKGNVSQRNEKLDHVLRGDYLLIDDNVNDVDMAVMPNAPIDTSTGLPIPTIACATVDGVSVIKDNGKVVDIYHTASTYYGAEQIKINGKQLIYKTQQSGSSQNTWRLVFIDIPDNDKSGSYTHNIADTFILDARGSNSQAQPTLNTNYDLGNTTNDIKWFAKDKAVAFTNKLTLLKDAGDVNGIYENVKVAYVTTSYNTGWMQGDTKLATLSDTTPGIVVSTELAPSSYASVNSFSVTFSSGTLSLNPPNASDYGANATVTGLKPGGLYTLSYRVTTAVDGSHGLQTIGSVTQDSRDIGGVGSYSRTINADSNGEIYIMFGRGSTGSTTGTVTNVFEDISLRIAEEDRTYLNQGLQVVGTVHKTQVAPGADLVAYSNFTSGNYLKQPHTSSLNFGTGDFSISAWCTLPTVNSPTRGIILERQNTSGGPLIQLFYYSDRFYVYCGGGTDYAYTSNKFSNTSQWYNVVVGVKGGTFKVYVNGKEEALTINAGPGNPDSSDAWMTVGVQSNGTSEPFTGGSIALLRITGTFPSETQISETYEDEQKLFVDNAKATLYGTSDSVTGLAYDEYTELVHAGTSSGRSVFNGLARIENTTDSVGTVISVVDGFVAEE